jgi:hypothetical protein
MNDGNAVPYQRSSLERVTKSAAHTGRVMIDDEPVDLATLYAASRGSGPYRRPSYAAASATSPAAAAPVGALTSALEAAGLALPEDGAPLTLTREMLERLKAAVGGGGGLAAAPPPPPSRPFETTTDEEEAAHAAARRRAARRAVAVAAGGGGGGEGLVLASYSCADRTRSPCFVCRFTVATATGVRTLPPPLFRAEPDDALGAAGSGGYAAAAQRAVAAASAGGPLRSAFRAAANAPDPALGGSSSDLATPQHTRRASEPAPSPPRASHATGGGGAARARAAFPSTAAAPGDAIPVPPLSLDGTQPLPLPPGVGHWRDGGGGGHARGGGGGHARAVELPSQLPHDSYFIPSPRWRAAEPEAEGHVARCV